MKSIFCLPTLCILLGEHISGTETSSNFLLLVSALFLAIAFFKLLFRIFPLGCLSHNNRYDGEMKMEGNLVHVPCTCYDIFLAAGLLHEGDVCIAPRLPTPLIVDFLHGLAVAGTNEREELGLVIAYLSRDASFPNSLFNCLRPSHS